MGALVDSVCHKYKTSIYVRKKEKKTKVHWSKTDTMIILALVSFSIEWALAICLGFLMRGISH
jgi:hypothetical protein